MARLTKRDRRKKMKRNALVAIICLMRVVNITLMFYMLIMNLMAKRVRRRSRLRLNPNVYQNQVDALNRLVRCDDKNYHDQLRVNRNTFMTLCHLLEERGLQNSRNVTIVEKVVIFLWVLAHHNKNRPTKFHFVRSEEKVSRHVNAVLLAVLRLYNELWYRPQPIPPNEPNHRWKWFENCLGALDDTFVPVMPLAEDRARYRSRKGDYAANVLGVCSRNLRFIYALSGWEGSASNSRVLRNALVRPHGFRIPRGRYFLADADYTNGSGMLAPYRDQRYHINIWRQGHQPQSREEYLNMKHSSAQNVVERVFGVLKMRFVILRSCSYYPIRTQCRIVTTCCLLHNLIKREMAIDPVEPEYIAWEQENVHIVLPDDYIDNIHQACLMNSYFDKIVPNLFVFHH